MMDYEFIIDGRTHGVSIEKEDGRQICRVDDHILEADIRRIAPGEFSILMKGKNHRVSIYSGRGVRNLVIEDFAITIREPGEDGPVSSEEDTGEAQLKIRAPMPGKVIKIDVSEGDRVRRNQTLAVVEAMKMENEIKSSIEAVVKSVSASPGDLVDPDDLLIELVREEGEPVVPD